MNTPKFTEKHGTNSNERLVPNPKTGGLVGTSMRVNSIDFAAELVLQLTELEKYIQGTAFSLWL
jgi:hypothetical protein